VQQGVRGQPEINAIATRSTHELEILIWNYHDDDLQTAPSSIDVAINGLPAEVHRAWLEHFRIESNHSNAYAAWQKMGSPQSPSIDQFRALESAGQLQLLDSPAWIHIDHGTTHVQFSLPRQALSLIRLGW
jgi:xylan 1,4-beta-xylosidase